MDSHQNKVALKQNKLTISDLKKKYSEKYVFPHTYGYVIIYAI